MPVTRSPEIWHRDDFSLLCNWRKLFTAVEVGVDRGEFAQEFLQHWRGHLWLGVDTWEPYPEMPWSRDADFLMATLRIERHARRAKLIKGKSVDVASLLATTATGYFNGPQQADFVYLDAAHDRDSVLADMRAWWPLLTEEGILAGHDHDAKHPGVVAAVEEFTRERQALAYVTTADNPPSWYIYRSGLPRGDWRRN